MSDASDSDTQYDFTGMRFLEAVEAPRRPGSYLLPDVVVIDSDGVLSLSAFSLYGKYCYECQRNEDRKCQLTSTEMVKLCNMSVPTIIKARDQLEGYSLIKVIRGDSECRSKRIVVMLGDPFDYHENGDMTWQPKWQDLPSRTQVALNESANRTPGRSLRKKVFERDAYRCRECGEWHDLTVDHIHPWSKGGLTKLSNLQTLCEPCNSRKKDRIDAEPR